VASRKAVALAGYARCVGQTDLELALVPDEVILLLTGVPATGKSTFGRYLGRELGFAHYDLECFPRGWAHADPWPLWRQQDFPAFIAQLSALDSRVVLDWGFPPHCYPIVEELRRLGATAVWFDGDRRRARELYIERAENNVALFDKQVAAIDAADLPCSLACRVVNTLGATGLPLDSRILAQTVFG
jgi:hypothetical protein